MRGHNDLNTQVKKALADAFLRRTLSSFVAAYRVDHARAFSDLSFQEARSTVRRIKEEAIARLPEFVEEFTRVAQAHGMKVYLARTEEEACRYITEVAVRRGARLIVKAKSMVTEEIHLNRFLEKQGIKVVETDLGEWILQVAGERPSHMVMPAIHKSKEQVALALSRYFGRDLPPEIPALVAAAREEIRRYFFEADIGVTGANFVVAETGTVVLVTNEGNGRLTSAVPLIHIVVVGMEKIIPRLQDLAPLLRMLPRAATGQKTTSYVTLISGPTGHPKKEVHVILLDNGRSSLRDDPLAQEALYCLRCSSCLNVCPVYELVGGHVFGGPTYPGGIGAILTAFFNGLADAGFNELCLGCHACTQYCPVKIDIPRLVLYLREKLAREKGLPLVKQLAYKTLANRRLFHGALRAAVGLEKLAFGRQEIVADLPWPFSRLTAFRSATLLASTPLRRQLPSKPEEGTKPRVAFYAGCVIDFMYPRIGLSVFEVLKKLGFAPYFPAGQSCCGVPAIYGGDVKAATLMARQNVLALADGKPDYIIYACPTCGVGIKNDFPRLLAADSKLGNLAAEIASRTYDFSEFLIKVAGVAGLPGRTGGARERITYHEPCHLGRHLGIIEEPRLLLARAGDLEFVEMEQSNQCCGFAGSYTLFYPEISSELLGKKLACVEETGAHLLATSCPGCVFQLAGGLHKRGNTQVKVLHLAEVVASRI